MKVSASFLSSRDKGKDIAKLNMTDVDYIHVDFMDGKFVKNKSLPVKELRKIYKYTSKRLDVHLMVTDPKKYIKKFADLNTEYITFHIEIKKNINELIDLIHSYGIKAGLAINPTTEVEEVAEYLNKIDMITIMSVEPGMGGQEFINASESKIFKIKELITKMNRDIVISVDGGIDISKKHLLGNADILVSGSYIVKSDNFQEKIDSLR